MEVLIRYDYPGTANGRPVGRVYVVGPLFHPDSGIFSYTYDPDEATVWTEEEARHQVLRRRWRDATLIRRETALDLRNESAAMREP